MSEENNTAANLLPADAATALADPNTKFTQIEKHDNEDVAAMFFKLEKPRLKRLLESLSAKQMRRLLMNVCSYPFIDNPYSPNGAEFDAAALVDRMLYHKAIMQLSFEIKKAEQASNKTNEPEVKGESTDGKETS